MVDTVADVEEVVVDEADSEIAVDLATVEVVAVAVVTAEDTVAEAGVDLEAEIVVGSAVEGEEIEADIVIVVAEEVAAGQLSGKD